MTFSQFDLLMNLVSGGQLDAEQIGGDEGYPTWDLKTTLVIDPPLGDLREEVRVAYNDGQMVEIAADGRVRWVTKEIA